MVQPTRRVVTGHDASGRAVVLIDGAAPNAKLRRATGLTSTLLWVTDRSPADNFGNADAAAREIGVAPPPRGGVRVRSEEHTSELQSLRHLVCRLLLEKKKIQCTTI